MLEISLRREKNILFTAFVCFVILALLGLYFVVPQSKAAMSSVSVTLSDSDLSARATSTLLVTIGTAIPINGDLRMTLPAGFSNITAASDITCPTNMVASTTATYPSLTAICTASAEIATGVVSGMTASTTNPSSAGSRTITITSKTAAAVTVETINTYVYIIDDVDVSATVADNFSFAIGAVNSGTLVNGTTTNITTTATTIPFDTLTANLAAVGAQSLTVTTNAPHGYAVTMQPNQDLVNSNGDKIYSFVDGNATNVQTSWANPSATPGSVNTYAHIGYTSTDMGIFTASSTFRGYSTTTARTVMDDTTPVVSAVVNVAYAVQASLMEPSGTYTNTLTYVCTPIY